MKCPRCGAENDDGSNFCGSCQASLTKDQQVTQPASPISQTYYPPGLAATQPATPFLPPLSPKSRSSPPPRRFWVWIAATLVVLTGGGGLIYGSVIRPQIRAQATSTAQTQTATAQSQFHATATAQSQAKATAEAIFGTWNLTQHDGILHIAYGSGTSVPEYAALDLKSSYLRLNYGPPSDWGTSLLLLPTFWSQTACSASGGYCQGAPVTATWQVRQSDLRLAIIGVIGGLNVNSQVDLSPPTKAPVITARVTTTIAGNVAVDTNRPGEAFKPMMLSSMHVSATQWDTQQASTDTHAWDLPQKGWIVQPPVSARSFSLKGGTSAWKTNAPTITVLLDQNWQVTGWVTKTTNPTDDNVGFWAISTNGVLPSWSFTVTASP